jgi:hypothetical protein
MHCLYCQKRLWMLFSKERLFCSKLHEAAYQEGLSAMNRLMEFTASPEPPKSPATSRVPLGVPMVQPLCNLVVTWGRPKPVAADLSAITVSPEAEPFARPIQFPSSATEPAAEIATTASQTVAACCRVRPNRNRRIPPTAFASRTHRRRLR